MRVGSLCSGYGGLELGLAQAGIEVETAWHAEVDPAASAVLAAHWPDVPNLGDLRAADWGSASLVDVVTAGYPCQPYSTAGKRKGFDDERDLWPAIAHALGVLRPRHVVLENVAAHVGRGLWRTVGDLAALGYDARRGVVRASDAGAPHRRERVFVLATDACRTTGGPRGAQPGDGGAPDVRRGQTEPRGLRGVAGVQWGAYEPAIRRWEHITGRPAPAPTEPGRNGPRLSPALVEWMMGLPAGWVTDFAARGHAMRILGNGVVPQQAAHALRLLSGLPGATPAATG